MGLRASSSKPGSPTRERARARSAIAAALVAAAALLAPLPATPQARQRPGDSPPKLEEFAPEAEPESPLTLPPLEPRSGDEAARPSAGLHARVRAFRVEGSTVFDAAELEALTAPYTGRVISSEQLLEARDAVTRYYIEHGYVTSGAVIPDQPIEDAEVVLRVVEGGLAKIEVSGAQGFRPSYFRDRLRRAGRRPVSLQRLERQLRRFQRQPGIRSVHGELTPGTRRGESVFGLAVDEERRFALSAMLGNPESPRIGAGGGWLRASYLNPLGRGDLLSAEFGGTGGLWNIDVRYRIPITSRDTELLLRFYQSRSDVVESPFDDLDIENVSVQYGIGLRHPVYRSPTQSLWLGLMGEYRKSKSYLLGERFSFGEGPEDGQSVVSVLRLVQDWTLRGRSDVLAARSTLSFGLDALGATTHGGDAPDGRFFAWLAQLQWGHRLPERYRGSELIARLDAQLTGDRLLSLEKFGMGGLRTVRGYQENQLVRDNGIAGSVELRVPVLQTEGIPSGLPAQRGGAHFAVTGRIASHKNGTRNAPYPAYPGGYTLPCGHVTRESVMGSDDLARRDPDFIREYAEPLLNLISRHYFRTTFEDPQNFPTDGPLMVVANHGGGPLLPDVLMLVAQWWKVLGVDRPGYAMVHDLAFRLPGLRDLLLRLGGLPGSQENARRVLEIGGTVLAFPGGEAEAQRSFRKRNRIDFRGRTGFVELALEFGVPIVPVVNVGGHEVYITLFSSELLARVTGLRRLMGLKALPVNLGLPWGIWPTGFLPYLPLPAKMAFRVGKAVHVPKDPALVKDRLYVAKLYTEITRTMQTMVDELAAERRVPILG